jgi:hypothetical protein
MEMSVKIIAVWSVLAITTMACGSSNPAAPTNSSVAPKSASYVAPQTATPAADSQIPWRTQPITISVANGATTASGTPIYTFEVATDAAFNNIVFSNANVPQGNGGQTSVTIPTMSGNTYYWRSRVTTGSVTGPNSTVHAFTIGPQPTVQTPLPWLPPPNGVTGSPTVLTVVNAQTSGPVGAIVYRFQVADSPTFTNIVFDSTIAEQTGAGTGGPQTSIVVTPGLTSGATYYWRVQAIDSLDNITTPFSTVNAFRVPIAVQFDHPWFGTVESKLRELLASGLAGPDGSNGQAVVDQLNAYTPWAPCIFQPHHNGYPGLPTYGCPWFYVSYLPFDTGAYYRGEPQTFENSFYQIVEYGRPLPGN